MTNNQLPFSEGSSINRPPLFCGDNYAFWKVRMKIFMESVHRNIWQAIVTDFRIPTITKEGIETEKPYEEWSQSEKNRAENDAKALNIIHSALNSDEFFRISACTTAKEAWELIQVTHEGTTEVRRARKNTLIQEYETFRMTQGETIMEMQKRFTHIVNHLKGLGKIFVEEEVNIKILKSLNRKWQPTVTAITESKDLGKMSSAELFGKLREYEMDMTRMDTDEQKDKRAKGLALKMEEAETNTDSSSCSDDSEDENLNLMVKNFKKFMRRKSFRKKNSQLKRNNRKGDSTVSKVTCYECGRPGHYKSDCPTLKNKNSNEEKKEMGEGRFRKDKNRKRRAYIAWDENDSSTSTDSENEEANICLMLKYESDSEVSNSDFTVEDYNELHEAFCELYKNAKRLNKLNIQLKSNNSVLNDKIIELQHNVEMLTKENETLKKPCLKCLKSLKSNNMHSASGSQLPHRGNRLKSCNITCSYCMNFGHSVFNCLIKKKGVPSGLFKWIEKSNSWYTNISGPKKRWVPISK